VQYSEPGAAKARLQAIMTAGDWAKMADTSKRYKAKKVQDRRYNGGGGSCVLFMADNDDEEAYQ
jgi:hypothetical protein